MDEAQVFQGLTMVQIALFAIYTALLVYFKIFPREKDVNKMINETLHEKRYLTHDDLLTCQIDCSKNVEEKFVKKETVDDIKQVINQSKEEQREIRDQLTAINQNISEFKSEIKGEVGRFVGAANEMTKIIEKLISKL